MHNYDSKAGAAPWEPIKVAMAYVMKALTSGGSLHWAHLVSASFWRLFSESALLSGPQKSLEMWHFLLIWERYCWFTQMRWSCSCQSPRTSADLHWCQSRFLLDTQHLNLCCIHWCKRLNLVWTAFGAISIPKLWNWVNQLKHRLFVQVWFLFYYLVRSVKSLCSE